MCPTASIIRSSSRMARSSRQPLGVSVRGRRLTRRVGRPALGPATMPARPPVSSAAPRHVSPWTAWLAGVALACLVAACGPEAPPPARPLVMASFYPLYEFTRHVAGQHAAVVSLVPPGVEPHDWEPSPQNVVEAQKAALFVYNDAGFDSWAEKLIGD